jgi:hypothetical protein
MNNVQYVLRKDGGWDLNEMQWRRDEHGTEEFELLLLRHVEAGNETCCGCRKPFAHPREVAMITTWISPPEAEKTRIEINGYCDACTKEHGADIATWQSRERTQ